MSNTPWHILGFGVIGQLLHAGFRRSGQACTVISKPGKALPAHHTVQYQDDHETYNIHPFEPSASPIEQLIVCTKSYDVIDAIGAVKDYLSPNVQIIVMVNGLIDPAEIATVTRGSVYWALTTEGGYRTETDTTIHGGNGMTHIGSGAQPIWFNQWQKALPNSHWQTNIDPFRWEKLCINAVINPLTALYQCRNGELADSALKTRTQTLIDEAATLLEALGFTQQAHGFNDSCWAVIRNTGANRSSMLQDVSLHRRTELSTILPPLLRAAAQHQVPTPQLQDTLSTFIKRFPDNY